MRVWGTFYFHLVMRSAYTFSVIVDPQILSRRRCEEREDRDRFIFDPDLWMRTSHDSPASRYALQMDAAGLALTTTRCARSPLIAELRRRKYTSDALRQIPTRHITKIFESGCDIAFE